MTRRKIVFTAKYQNRFSFKDIFCFILDDILPDFSSVEKGTKPVS